MLSLIFLDMNQVIGNMTKGTINVNIPPQPVLKQIIMVPPTTAKGNINPAIIKGSFVSIELKSLLNKFIILPNYDDLELKELSLDTLAYISRMSPALILQEIIGLE